MATPNHLINTSLGSPTNSHKDSMPIDLNDVEMVFGTPSSPRQMKPDIHHINERKPGQDANGHPHKPNGVTEHPTLEPLLEPDKEKPKPPLAGPEIDDLDNAQPTEATPYPGIDDGLLEPAEKNHVHHEGGDLEGEGSHHSHETHPTRDDGVGTEDGKWPWPPTDEADYPYDGFSALSPRFGIDDRPGSPLSPGTSIPDVNTYQQKKNLAQGMMDLALLSANANQLRYVVESAASHPYYYPSLTFIALSIVLQAYIPDVNTYQQKQTLGQGMMDLALLMANANQLRHLMESAGWHPYYYPSLALVSFCVVLQIAVGIGLIMKSRCNIKYDKDICKADKINNMTVLGVFFITVVNVFTTLFSVASPTTVIGGGTPVATIQPSG